MQKTFIKAQLTRAAEDSFTFIASDETLDRTGEVIPIDSWDLRNYKKNPVLLVNHDYKVENIVGLARGVRVEEGKLLFDAVFHGITQLSRDVKEMVAQKVLSTVSVGFMRHGPVKDGDTEHNELFEVSFVPVPANPSAARLKSLMDAGIAADEKSAIADWVEKQSIKAPMEMQTIICSKETFTTAEKAAEWCSSHDFRSDKMDETDDSFRFRQFDPEMCEADSFRTIDITEGVKGVTCKKEKAASDIDLKEGRVLSGKNRSLITDAVSILKQAADALGALLEATEPKSMRDGKDKGRNPKVAHTFDKTTVRALQVIAGASNEALRKIKQSK